MLYAADRNDLGEIPVSGGPIVVFDKSALQSFSLDEAVLFDNFYLPVITPLFFMETLADLEKKVREGQTPEQAVGIIAAKTPIMSGIPNVHHLRLVQYELLGHDVELCRRPLVGQGRQVTTGDRRGIMIKELPEMDAFQRWQDGSFLDIERQYARRWRTELARWDPGRGNAFRAVVGAEARVRDLSQAKEVADRLVRGSGQRHAVLKAIFEIFGVPEAAQQEILRRWKLTGGPSLPEFAPYTSHVVRVEFFLQLAVQSSLISSERVSNKVDMVYLYYLPFCMAFISDDALHMRTVPLFLNDRQTFIPGDELKADLAKLGQHYSALPPEVLEKGIYSFAPHPPIDGSFLTTRLWDRFMRPDWRERMTRGPKRSPESDARLLAELQRMDAAEEDRSGEPISSDSARFLSITRRIPIKRGKWRIISREAEGQ
jgi:hypothetical protein